jgi:hypothetical protein
MVVSSAALPACCSVSGRVDMSAEVDDDNVQCAVTPGQHIWCFTHMARVYTVLYFGASWTVLLLFAKHFC